MAKKAAIGRSGDVTMSDAQKVIPGMENGDYRQDQAPFYINSPVMAFSTSVLANQGSFMVPFDCTVVKQTTNAIAAPTATGGGTVNIGTKATATAIGQIVLATGATGYLTATNAAVDLDQGDIVEFGLGVETAVGSVAVTLVCVPRNS